MTLNQLKYFQTVARLENYRAAADELFISQPSLSRSMYALSEELGVQLFEKTGRGVSLTSSGKLFLEYVDRILEDCDIALYKMKELAEGGGRIDIGYVFPLANYYIPQKVRKFLDQDGNSNVTFGFMQSRSAHIVQEIRSGRVDVGFCAHTEGDEELESFPLIKQEMLIITPMGHELSGEGRLSIHELENYPVIGYDRHSALGRYTKRLYRDKKIKPKIICECADENAIQALVRENFGIALVAEVEALNPEEVSIHELSDTDLTHLVSMVWRRNHYQMPAIQRFIDFMQGEQDL